MTENEKRMRHEWHDANYDEEILKMREKTNTLCEKINAVSQYDPKRNELLKQALEVRELPEGLEILSPVYMDLGGKNIRFGKNDFFNHGTYFMDNGTITFGDHVFVGPYCGFYTSTHPMDYVSRNKGLEKALAITVGDNCWFGANVSVMPGVHIGNGCVIAAGSVVTHDLPDNSMAAGVPAEVKKTIDQNSHI